MRGGEKKKKNVQRGYRDDLKAVSVVEGGMNIITRAARPKLCSVNKNSRGGRYQRRGVRKGERLKELPLVIGKGTIIGAI